MITAAAFRCVRRCIPMLAIAFAFTIAPLSPNAARADDAAVQVSYDDNLTQLGTLTVGDFLFRDNTKRHLKSAPAEVLGLIYTMRPIDAPVGTVAIDAPANSTVYLLVVSRSDRKTIIHAVTDAGWTALPQGLRNESPNFGRVNVYRRDFTEPTHVELSGEGKSCALMVAAAHLVLGAVIKPGSPSANPPDQNSPSPSVDTTIHAEKDVDERPVPGPATRPARQQTSITCLEILQTDAGLMLGQTSEATLTITAANTPHRIAVSFVTPIGSEMRLARDEAQRYVRLKYPNWYAQWAEISFEDKYTNHEGGSNGAAVATMIESIINGFDIDPGIAITGDISANGKIRAIGGLGAKLRGAINGNFALAAVPTANEPQLVDAAVYNGISLPTDIHVLGISTMDDAIATVRTDRADSLKQAIALFADVQTELKAHPDALKNPELKEKLHQILQLAPQDLSAKLLLQAADGALPTTLSATASEYYTYLAVRNMVEVLKNRAESPQVHAMPSSVIRNGFIDLRKLRPRAAPSVRPLIDAWINFLQAVSDAQQGMASPQRVEAQRQALLDEMDREDSNVDLMQQMLKEGI